ncbi:MAG: thymidine phosphorylase, partial [Paracoccaceae bacterium]
WSLPGPVLDKHSTGGIGDNVSLVLAPALAAAGAFVPMISGRGLGHTGGTLDKLDAIAGYQSEVPVQRMREIVARVGCAIVGASNEIAPADKRLYAVRDVTATVESADLITASILSKKLAAGLEGLVLDVKTGSGAFIADAHAAAELAETMVKVANDAGCPMAALVSDMNEPLASAAGNALEVLNAVLFLRGDAIDNRLWDVTLALGGALLEIGGLCERAAEGQAMIAATLQSGAAAEKFAQMVDALGGDSGVLDQPQKILPRAPVVAEVVAPSAGFITSIDGRALGEAVVGLGGGRKRQNDRLDPSVGLDRIAGIGARVEPGDPLALIHARDDATLKQAGAGVLSAFEIGPHPAPERPLIVKRIG